MSRRPQRGTHPRSSRSSATRQTSSRASSTRRGPGRTEEPVSPRSRRARSAQKSPTLPLILGGAAILLTGIFVLIFLRATSESKENQSKQEQADAKERSQPRVIEEPDDPPASNVEAASPTGGNRPGKTEKSPRRDVLDLNKKKRRVRLEPQALAYADSVPPDRRERIDALIAVATDLNATTEAHSSREELVRVGLDAVPPMLSRWHEMDMGNLDQVIAANILVDILTEICELGGREFYRFQVQGTDPEHVEFRQTVKERWFRWWGENRDELRGEESPSEE